MTVAHILGFPRIGAGRELKFALEAFWRGESEEPALRETGRELRQRHWRMQREAGLDFVAVGDFAWYDQVLSTCALLGALPERFGFDPGRLTLGQYFAAARGSPAQPAMEMTKWFDTNYHYLVPEFTRQTRFPGGRNWLPDEIEEAIALGFRPKPVLLGPLSFLYLGKEKQRGFSRLELLPELSAAYQRILAGFKSLGVEWVQMDEPILALDLGPEWLEGFLPAYAALAAVAPPILLATYFGEVARRREWLHRLPVSGLHLDCARAPEQLEEFVREYPQRRVLSAGVIDGRNIWRADLRPILSRLAAVRERLGDRLWLAPSCSLLHVPVDLRPESKLDPELRGWLAFAAQKMEEVVTLKRGLEQGGDAMAAALEASARVAGGRRAARRVRNEAVRQRVAGLAEADFRRASDFPVRIERQRQAFRLPLLPTTTIGSFPQTAGIRSVRAAFKQGRIGFLAYLERMREEIADAIRRQESCGLDVLVHGEAERNDMVEYFAEHLSGFAFTEGGWVQSYGSRCVKPPIIYGDVSRPEPITVDWSGYAQSLTEKPVKGMLTGPVTMLQWAFVRDDQPRAATALQIALALRDEVADLEKAGIRIIQIDEPAFREGLPLKRAEWAGYLDWAVGAFKAASCGVADTTQIHTHMCYSEFNDILPAIAALDADVITIETSRSDMELLEAFREFRYPNDIGPGVYDIHSPRVPSPEEMVRLLEKAAEVIPPERLWVNPDCGLKTRGWPEVEAALSRMVAAAKQVRSRLAAENGELGPLPAAESPLD